MIWLMSSWSAEYQSLADITWVGSKVPYAQRHGYQLHHAIHAPGIGIMKDRMVLWLDALNRISDGDWLFFTGCDALISRADIRVEKFITDGEDFICCTSHDVVFGDVWLMKSNARTKRMLATMIESFTGQLSEQELFVEALSFNTWDGYKVLIPQNWGEESCYAGCEAMLNCTDVKVRIVRPHEKLTGDDHTLWPGNIPPYHWWSPEHLVFHMGGKSLEDRVRLISGYSQRI